MGISQAYAYAVRLLERTDERCRRSRGGGGGGGGGGGSAAVAGGVMVEKEEGYCLRAPTSGSSRLQGALDNGLLRGHVLVAQQHRATPTLLALLARPFSRQRRRGAAAAFVV